MLHIAEIRRDPEKVKKASADKGVNIDKTIDELLELDKELRNLIAESEQLRHQHKITNEKGGWIWKTLQRKTDSKKKFTRQELQEKLEDTYQQIRPIAKDGLPKVLFSDVEELMTGLINDLELPSVDVDDALERAGVVFGMIVGGLGAPGQKLKNKRNQIEAKIKERMLEIPNVAQGDVPVGGGDKNKVLREWGEERKFDFEPRAHWDIGKELGILDIELAAKLAGSNFALFMGAGAKLVRALMNFMLDAHAAKGYTEVWPPVLANRRIMTGTGQLPKFEEDMYRFEKDDMFLVPTAEVPLTALHAGEILAFTDLPLGYCAYTPCFRREAGAYGRETRGLLRVHQFDKVELLKFTTEEQSKDEHEKLLADAEGIIQRLGLRYRVQLLATGEMSFAASRTYDIDIWSPGVKRWLEVSSVSNFESFQARRLSIRYRDQDRKVKFCHTLNGSGVAFARLIACLLETYQRADGTVEIPEALQAYFGAERIEKA